MTPAKTSAATTHRSAGATSVVIGLDLPGNDLAALEHRTLTWLDDEGIEAMEVATHILSGWYVASVALVGDAPHALASADEYGFVAARHSNPVEQMVGPHDTRFGRAVAAASSHHLRTGGRLVRFDGDALTKGKEVNAATLASSSCIDEVVALGAIAGPDAVVVTSGFARPIMQFGRTVLIVTALSENRFRPFETQNPHQCCGGH